MKDNQSFYDFISAYPIVSKRLCQARHNQESGRIVIATDKICRCKAKFCTKSIQEYFKGVLVHTVYLFFAIPRKLYDYTKIKRYSNTFPNNSPGNDFLYSTRTI